MYRARRHGCEILVIRAAATGPGQYAPGRIRLSLVRPESQTALQPGLSPEPARLLTRERPPWLQPPWLPMLLPCTNPPLHTITDMYSSTLSSTTTSTAYRMRDNTANSLASELDRRRRAAYVVPVSEQRLCR